MLASPVQRGSRNPDPGGELQTATRAALRPPRRHANARGRSATLPSSCTTPQDTTPPSAFAIHADAGIKGLGRLLSTAPCAQAPRFRRRSPCRSNQKVTAESFLISLIFFENKMKRRNFIFNQIYQFCMKNFRLNLYFLFSNPVSRRTQQTKSCTKNNHVKQNFIRDDTQNHTSRFSTLRALSWMN